MTDCCEPTDRCWIHEGYCTRCHTEPADGLCAECQDDLLAEEAVVRGKAGEWGV